MKERLLSSKSLDRAKAEAIKLMSEQGLTTVEFTMVMPAIMTLRGEFIKSKRPEHYSILLPERRPREKTQVRDRGPRRRGLHASTGA